MGVGASPDSRRVAQQACTAPAGLATCKLRMRDNWRHLNKNSSGPGGDRKRRGRRGVGVPLCSPSESDSVRLLKYEPCTLPSLL